MSDGIRDAKRDGDVGVVGVGPVIFLLEKRREDGERLAVNIVNDGGSEQNPTDPPAQGGNGVRS